MANKHRRRLRVPVPLSAAEAQGEIDTARVVAHYDGFYWVSDDGHHETGPFATFEDAAADMDRAEGGDADIDASVGAAREELGIADWVDPETQELASDGRTRLEEH